MLHAAAISIVLAAVGGTTLGNGGDGGASLFNDDGASLGNDDDDGEYGEKRCRRCQ